MRMTKCGGCGSPVFKNSKCTRCGYLNESPSLAGDIRLVFSSPAPSRPAPYTPRSLCLQCHTLAHPIRRWPGSGLFNVILFGFLILPGVLYFAWRWRSRYDTCPTCGGRTLIPEHSPAAIAIIDKAPD